MNIEDYDKLERFLTENIDDFYFGLLLCMHTGIRVGEAGGLRWVTLIFPSGKYAYKEL